MVTLHPNIKIRCICGDCGHELEAFIKPFDNHRPFPEQDPPDYEIEVTECPNCIVNEVG